MEMTKQEIVEYLKSQVSQQNWEKVYYLSGVLKDMDLTGFTMFEIEV